MKTINYLLSIFFITSFTILSAQTINYGTNSGIQGNFNSFFGYNTGNINTADYNTFLGFNAGQYNTTGTLNVFIGSMAGKKNTIGKRNVFIGHFSGYTNTTGSRNTAIGMFSGQKNTTGTYNTFLGYDAGHDNTTANSNSFFGAYSGEKNTIGMKNTFFGAFSGRYNSTGEYNTFTGSDSGGLNTLGSFNTFYGSSAGENNTTGSNNTFLGNQAGYSIINGQGNTFLGHKAGYNETGSNKLYIDNSDTNTPLLYGDFSSNQLGINTNIIPTGYAFAVKGKMIAEELKVQVFPWADFVFESTYRLPTLAEVEKHIKEKGHLQNIPNAKEVAKNGIKIGEMNAKLLQKIEELTLYTIQQQKEIIILKNLKKENEILKARLDKIEAFLLKKQSE